MDTKLEERIQKKGLRLYEIMEGETPSVFKKDYWIGKIMNWSMQNEAFKTEMFRFVDVFPYLKSPASVAKHIQEYFCRPEQDFPKAMQWGLQFVSPDSLTARFVAGSTAKNIKNMGKQFIVGADLQEAAPALRELRDKGMAFTMSILGEAVISKKDEERYLADIIKLLDDFNELQKDWPALGSGSGELDWGCSPKSNVSIKTSGLYAGYQACAFEYSVDRFKERLRLVYRKAMEVGAYINLDMEHLPMRSLILATYKSLLEEPEFRDYPYTGICFQTYLRDSEQELKELIQWGKKRGQVFGIRLVKGGYYDEEVVYASQNNYPVPVFTNKHETDAVYEKLARLVLENHEYITLKFGSHNIRSVAAIVETARDLRIPEDKLEFQLLNGMAENLRTAFVKAGLHLRLYAPIGEIIPGIAYLVRRLMDNTSNESFLRLGFAEGISKDKLLGNPLELMKENPGPPEPLEEAPEYGDKGPFKNETPIGWIAKDREDFGNALKKARKGFPQSIPIYIEGKKVVTEKKILSTNPNRPDEVVGEVASAGVPEMKKAVAAAKAAFSSWRDTEPDQRSGYLFRAAEIVRKMRHKLAALLVYEVGKNWNEAHGEVCAAIDFLEYYGREMIRLSVPRRMGRVLGENSQLFYEPRGVGAVITPWNFPLSISIGMTAATIVTGNTLIYKPSSQSPVIGSMVYKIFQEAGVPNGILNYLPGRGDEIGDFLVTHPDVAFITFTGSREVGLRIMEMAGKTPEGAMGIKNVVLEMGGKNAIIVDSDADMDEVVVNILQSAFSYQGQKCSSCSRLIVLEENYDRLVERIREAAENLDLGPVEDPRNFMGAVIDASAKKKIEEYVEIGKRDGKLLLEGNVSEPKGHFVPIYIFTDIRPEHRLAQEEIFGPLLCIIRVKDFDEALQVANGTKYALTGSIFSRSPGNIKRACTEFRAGNLNINRGTIDALVGRHPFGGFKMSGMGPKTGGPDYLVQYMIQRTVVENTIRSGFAPMEEAL